MPERCCVHGSASYYVHLCVHINTLEFNYIRAHIVAVIITLHRHIERLNNNKTTCVFFYYYFFFSVCKTHRILKCADGKLCGFYNSNVQATKRYKYDNITIISFVISPSVFIQCNSTLRFFFLAQKHIMNRTETENNKTKYFWNRHHYFESIISPCVIRILYIKTIYINTFIWLVKVCKLSGYTAEKLETEGKEKKILPRRRNDVYLIFRQLLRIIPFTKWLSFNYIFYYMQNVCKQFHSFYLFIQTKKIITISSPSARKTYFFTEKNQLN